MKFSQWKALKASIAQELAAALSGRADRRDGDLVAALRRKDRDADRQSQRHFIVSDRAYASVWSTVDGAVRALLTRKEDSAARQISILVSGDGADARIAGFSAGEVSGALTARSSALRWVSGDDDLPDGVTMDVARRMWLS